LADEKAKREQAINDRIAERRGVPEKPAAVEAKPRVIAVVADGDQDEKVVQERSLADSGRT
jgi:hypothetical protein